MQRLYCWARFIFKRLRQRASMLIVFLYKRMRVFVSYKYGTVFSLYAL